MNSQRYKSTIGYCILCIGVVIALWLAGQAIHHSDERAERQSAVICQNATTSDRQQLSNLITKSGHELIKDFHLTLPQAAVLVHKQLEISAHERKSLQPSKPASACTGKLTTIKINPPPVSKESAAALKIAATAASE